MAMNKCLRCDKLVNTKHNKFCSRKCYGDSKRLPAIEALNCSLCSTPFGANIKQRRYHAAGKQVYCSSDHQHQAHRTRMTKPKKVGHCLTCMEVFHIKRKEKYCSKKCYWKTMEYTEGRTINAIIPSR